jgi:lysophospholipase L1-like esterase
MLVLFILLFLILLAEGVVRARQYIKYGTFVSVATYHEDAASGLRIPVPNFKTATISINSQGFRGPEIEMPKSDGVFRLAFVGASTTYCAEVSSNEMVWAHLVSEGLAERYPARKIDYINGGVSGYSTATSLINLEKRILPLSPDVVVIYHATNDLSAESRKLARQANIERTNLEQEESWLGRYSLLWHLVEKNLLLMEAQTQTAAQMLPDDIQMQGTEFRENLERLVQIAREGGVKQIVLVTFSIHPREEMSSKQLESAMVSAKYYMPYFSGRALMQGFRDYNQIIREVAYKTGAVLIERESYIPGDAEHFVDSVHFTDLGSLKQADRILDKLVSNQDFQKMLTLER